MIVANRKPLAEILEMVDGCGRVMILGCKGCVTVCNVGGLKEVQVLSSSLKIARKKEGRPLEVEERVLERQCDPEYIELVKNDVHDFDAVVSMACGVGPQFLSEAYPEQRFFPAVDTTFFGGAVRHGVWEERCKGCGTCVIHKFDGLCPIARCSKSLMNGPCGGSSHGSCEIGPDTVCIWDRIVRKKMEQGRIDDLTNIAPAKNWQSAWHGGPRRRVREDLTK
jgi:ferredoxin